MDEFYMYNELQAVMRDIERAYDVLRAEMRELGYDPYNTADVGV